MISQYQSDFDFVTQAIEDGYIFLKTKEEEWGFKFDEVKQRCAGRLSMIASDFEFWLLLKEVVAPLHDSHTWIGFDAPWVTSNRWGLPFEITCLEGTNYVAGWREGVSPIDEIDIGDRVVSIGGFSIHDVQTIYERYEGLSTRVAQEKMCMNQFFSYYLPDTEPDRPVKVNLISGGGRKKATQVSWVRSPGLSMPEPQSMFSHRWLRMTPRLAYLRIQNFFLPQFEHERLAVAKLNTIFEEIQLADGLIIDVRHNGGGSFTPMKEVIARLIQKPIPNFRRRWLVSGNFIKYHELGARYEGWKGHSEWVFDGEGNLPVIEPASECRLRRSIPIYILTDFQTLSRTEELIVLLKEADVARTVGETTGGGYANPMSVSLPETGWEFKYSVGEGRSPKGFNIEGKGVKPDFPVAFSLDDIGSKQDRYLKEAERLYMKLSEWH